jgi:isocitrate dehydrogenase
LAESTPITVAHGDGIGPEIMDSTLRILDAAGARLKIETVEIGEGVFKRGVRTGIEPSAWDSIRKTRVFLKAPITTPQGGGFVSLNVTIRKTLGLYANIRPCAAYHPFVDSKHPHMDLVIIRENEEDLYAGIEYRVTDQVTECLKLISRPGCEKIVRYAFEFARHNNRERVSCFTKDNIMKMTDGLFHKVFDEIAADYPDIEHSHMIVDIGSARLADTPERFDVIVLPNLYGDILSDVAAQLIGSVGLCGSSNIGEHGAMFEAIHGSAPDIAGHNVANPSGLLLGAVMMLVHIGQGDIAESVHNAWLRLIEDGIHTADIYKPHASKLKISTKEFTSAVVDRIGSAPKHFKPVSYRRSVAAYHEKELLPVHIAVKELVGIDLYFHWTDGTPDQLADILKGAATKNLPLRLVNNRGVKVWPDGMPETFCTDFWRARFVKDDGSAAITHHDCIELLTRVAKAKLDVVETAYLSLYDGQPGYSTGQGE